MTSLLVGSIPPLVSVMLLSRRSRSEVPDWPAAVFDTEPWFGSSRSCPLRSLTARLVTSGLAAPYRAYWAGVPVLL